MLEVIDPSTGEGFTVTGLAAALGYKRNTVSIAIHHTNLPRVRARVLSVLGLSD